MGTIERGFERRDFWTRIPADEIPVRISYLDGGHQEVIVRSLIIGTVSNSHGLSGHGIGMPIITRYMVSAGYEPPYGVIFRFKHFFKHVCILSGLLSNCRRYPTYFLVTLCYFYRERGVLSVTP